MIILKTSEIILYKHCFYYSLFVKDTLKFVSNQSYYARCSFFKQVHLICRIGSADYCGMFSYLQLKSKFYNSKGNIQLIFHTGRQALFNVLAHVFVRRIKEQLIKFSKPDKQTIFTNAYIDFTWNKLIFVEFLTEQSSNAMKCYVTRNILIYIDYSIP